MAAPSSLATTCLDFLKFQDTLKTLRQNDDRIINILNIAIPTQSFTKNVNATNKCKELRDELKTSHQSRVDLIKNCITYQAQTVDRLRCVKEESPDDLTCIKDLRKNQTRLRLLQNELNIEEVVQERTNKVLYEKCRDYYLG